MRENSIGVVLAKCIVIYITIQTIDSRVSSSEIKHIGFSVGILRRNPTL